MAASLPKPLPFTTTTVSSTIRSSPAAENSVNGSAFALQAGDIQTGNWSGGTFTSGGTPLNAVRVAAQMSSTRGNAVRLLFGQVIGMSGCNVTATCVGTAQFSSSYG